VVILASLVCTSVARGDDLTGADDARPFGLSERVPLTTSRVFGSPDPPHPYHIRRVYKYIQLNQSVYLIQEPLSERLFFSNTSAV
jgi:hypothetical protein